MNKYSFKILLSLLCLPLVFSSCKTRTFGNVNNSTSATPKLEYREKKDKARWMYGKCPDDFVLVERNRIHSELRLAFDKITKSSGFCVARLESRVEVERNKNTPVKMTPAEGDGKAVVGFSSLLPLWVGASRDEAIAACSALSNQYFSYSLISNREWQLIAQMIELTEQNWTRVNGDALKTGNSISHEVRRETLDSLMLLYPPQASERSLESISVYDFVGNVSEYVRDNLSDLSVDATELQDPRNLFEAKALKSPLKEHFGPFRTYKKGEPGFFNPEHLGFVTASKGGEVIVRGCHALCGQNTGVFAAHLGVGQGHDKPGELSTTGFRCVANPIHPWSPGKKSERDDIWD